MPSDPLEDYAVHTPVSPIQQPISAEPEDPRPAIEVMILWGDTVLHVAHLVPARAFYIGDDDTADYVIGRESLGTDRLPIVLESAEGHCVVFGPHADGEISWHDRSVSLSELDQAGQLRSHPEHPAARLYPLPLGAAACVRQAGFTFLVKPIAMARWVDLRENQLSVRRHAWTATSTLLHVLVLVAFYFMPPQSSALSIDRLVEDPRWVAYAVEPPARDADMPDWMVQQPGAAEGGGGRAQEGPSGKMGDTQAKPSPRRFAIKGTAPNPQLSRQDAKLYAAKTGLIGVLKAFADANQAPNPAFNRALAEGSDPSDENGGLLGLLAGADRGNGGFGMIGTGRGGGGDGNGTIGTGVGTVSGLGQGDGRGPGYGAPGGMHGRGSHIPRIRSGSSDVRGSLSKELIRRTIHQHINEVRACYEQALIARPDLEGRASIKFIIGPSGAVQAAALESTDLPDANVGRCIAASVQRWQFPAPEGAGLVIVTYPFLLSQSGG
jgi:hypothetical protein